MALIQRIHHTRQKRAGPGMGDQVDDHLRIGSGLKDRAVRFEFVAQHLRVDQIAVVRQRQATEVEIGEDRLDVAVGGAAGRGIAVVADRGVPVGEGGGDGQ